MEEKLYIEDDYSKENPKSAGCLALTGLLIINGIVLAIKVHERITETKEKIKNLLP